MPFEGGSEVQLNLSGKPRNVSWVDSVTLIQTTRTAAGLHASLLDVRTGTSGAGIDVADSLIPSITPVAGGWAWIPSTVDRVIIEREGKRTEVPAPKWYESIFDLRADAAGQRLVMLGWNSGSNDSLGAAVIPVVGGEPVMWVRSYAEGGGVKFLADGSLLLNARPTQEAVGLQRVRAPGDVQLLGLVPRPATGVSVSSDLKRMVVVERSYHSDAYMSRIVRQ
jgi:hypothetical protein